MEVRLVCAEVLACEMDAEELVSQGANSDGGGPTWRIM